MLLIATFSSAESASELGGMGGIRADQPEGEDRGRWSRSKGRAEAGPAPPGQGREARVIPSTGMSVWRPDTRSAVILLVPQAIVKPMCPWPVL